MLEQREKPKFKVEQYMSLLEKRIAKLLFSLLAVIEIFSPANAHAQAEGLTGVEISVFDRQTGRPLQNALVVLTEFLGPSSVATKTETYGHTDSNGFFAFEYFKTAEGIGYAVSTACVTTRGKVASVMPLYTNIRADTVYQRTFYLELPRNFSGPCIGSGFE